MDKIKRANLIIGGLICLSGVLEYALEGELGWGVTWCLFGLGFILAEPTDHWTPRNMAGAAFFGLAVVFSVVRFVTHII